MWVPCATVVLIEAPSEHLAHRQAAGADDVGRILMWHDLIGC
jgi:hypothetical protein